MSVFLISKVYYLINGHALPEFGADKIFLLHRPPGHVTGTVYQKQLPALAAGTSEIRSHQPNLTLEAGIVARCKLEHCRPTVGTRYGQINHFNDQARR
jgi:hypothetical protein